MNLSLYTQKYKKEKTVKSKEKREEVKCDRVLQIVVVEERNENTKRRTEKQNRKEMRPKAKTLSQLSMVMIGNIHISQII